MIRQWHKSHVLIIFRWHHRLGSTLRIPSCLQLQNSHHIHVNIANTWLMLRAYEQLLHNRKIILEGGDDFSYSNAISWWNTVIFSWIGIVTCHITFTISKKTQILINVSLLSRIRFQHQSRVIAQDASGVVTTDAWWLWNRNDLNKTLYTA